MVMQRYRLRNRLVGLGLLVGVALIYSYPFLSVKQETFLDEEFNRHTGDERTTKS